MDMSGIPPSNRSWYRPPAKIADGQNVTSSIVPVKLTDEMKAELAAHKATEAQMKAERDSRREANPDLYSNNVESHTMYETNVATLPAEDVEPRIEYITHLIQSGEADKYSFRAGNGEQTTTSIHQFLYWLQQRAQEINSDGTYAPDMFK